MTHPAQLQLFEVEAFVLPDPLPQPPRYERGGSQAVTWRRRAESRIAAGQHPTGPRLRAPDGEACRTCTHVQVLEYRTRNVHQCALARPGHRRNLRLKWPACALWCAKEVPMK